MNMVQVQSPPQRVFVKSPWLSIAIPLLFQGMIVFSIPAQKAYTLTTGTTVFLQTVPVDPYDLLRGRYVTLDYAAAQQETLETVPGWAPELQEKPVVYVILKPGEALRDPWIPVGIQGQFPQTIPPGHQVIQGRWRRWGGLDFGLSQYFIPEGSGAGLEADLSDHPQAARAEVKVDAQGRSALVQLWVEDRNY